MTIPTQAAVKRTRTRHHKSRNGCLECKRRRVKCDESKPSCTRCVLGLLNCIYSATPQCPLQSELHKPISSINHLSSSPSTSSFSNCSLSLETSPLPVSPCVKGSHTPKGLSDDELYHHNLQYTSRTLSLSQSDHCMLHINKPALATQSETVSHALLAVSAANVAWNMISQEPAPTTDTVTQVLLTGYHHYNLASEQMREAMSGPAEGLNPEPLIVSMILVPFVTASQQINHWISSRSGGCKPLSSTPRDVIVIMRGIRTMLETLNCSTEIDISPQTDCWIDMAPATKPQASSRTHVMSSIVATTSRAAFSALRRRLDSLLRIHNGRLDPALAACSAAFDALDSIRSSAFDATDSPSQDPELFSSLHAFTTPSKTPRPIEPLTRFFLSFLTQAPQEYLDLVLPLLDQRLESPVSIPVELTRIQALALDIYAHWSIVMMLVEEESWWIGTLPVVTLLGMVNRYGEGFVGALWPDEGPEEQWWPGSMLRISRDVKKFR